MIVEIECIASPPGTPEDRFKHVDAAVAVIQQSGRKYEVGALGTTLEGEPDDLWPLLRRVHEACLESGARGVISIIKVGQTGPGIEAPSMESITRKFRD